MKITLNLIGGFQAAKRKWKFELSGRKYPIVYFGLSTVKELAQCRVCHSVTHHPQVMQTQPDVEARDSKRLIEEWIGSRVTSFCYPFYLPTHISLTL